jgi:hypothetical protein
MACQTFLDDAEALLKESQKLDVIMEEENALMIKKRKVEKWITSVRDVLDRVHKSDKRRAADLSGDDGEEDDQPEGEDAAASKKRDAAAAAAAFSGAPDDAVMGATTDPSGGEVKMETTTTDTPEIELETKKTLDILMNTRIAADKERNTRGKKKKNAAAAKRMVGVRKAKPHVQQLVWLIEKGADLPVNLWAVQAHLLNLVGATQVWQHECRASLQDHERKCQADCQLLLTTLKEKKAGYTALATTMSEETKPSPAVAVVGGGDGAAAVAVAVVATGTLGEEAAPAALSPTLTTAVPSTLMDPSSAVAPATLPPAPVQTVIEPEPTVANASGIQKAIETIEREKRLLQAILVRFGEASNHNHGATTGSSRATPTEDGNGTTTNVSTTLTTLLEQASMFSVATMEELELQKHIDVDRWRLKFNTLLGQMHHGLRHDDPALLAASTSASAASTSAAGVMVRLELASLELLVEEGIDILGNIMATEDSSAEVGFGSATVVKRKQRRKSTRDPTSATKAKEVKDAVKDKDDDEQMNGEEDSAEDSEPDSEQETGEEFKLSAAETNVAVTGVHVETLKNCLHELQKLLEGAKAWEESADAILAEGDGVSLEALETTLAGQAALPVDAPQTHQLLETAEGAAKWLGRASEAYAFFLDRQRYRRWLLVDMQALSEEYVDMHIQLGAHGHVKDAVSKGEEWLAKLKKSGLEKLGEEVRVYVYVCVYTHIRYVCIYTYKICVRVCVACMRVSRLLSPSLFFLSISLSL